VICTLTGRYVRTQIILYSPCGRSSSQL